jgi:hypothetical protein
MKIANHNSFVTHRARDMTADENNFVVSIALSVRDVNLLWRMAAAHALDMTGMEQEDVEDVIGALDDPSISDCLAMLLVPKPIAGCALSGFSVEPSLPVARRQPSSSKGKSKSGALPLFPSAAKAKHIAR